MANLFNGHREVLRVESAVADAGGKKFDKLLFI